MIADLAADQALKDQAPTLEQCQQIVDERCPGTIVLKNPRWTSYYRVHHRIVDKLQEGRVFVAGDAAHIHSPAAAQGMNTGIQDAYNLAWKLALVSHGLAGEGLLATYNEERYPVERGVLDMTDFLLQTVSLKQPLALKMRDTLLPLLSGTKLFQEQMGPRISETAISYHGSSVCLDFDHGQAPRAGDRAPDCEATHADGFPARLSQLLQSNKFVLLMFPGHGDAQLMRLIEAMSILCDSPLVNEIERYGVLPESIPTPGGMSALRDSAGAWSYRTGFGIGHAGLRLIRPDGYIALRASADEAHVALAAWCRALAGG